MSGMHLYDHLKTQDMLGLIMHPYDRLALSRIINEKIVWPSTHHTTGTVN